MSNRKLNDFFVYVLLLTVFYSCEQKPVEYEYKLEKNHEMCRICDEQDYNKFHDKMSGVFANVRNEFTSKVERSELFKVIHSNVNLLKLSKSEGDGYDKISISVKIEEDVLRHFKDKRL